MEDQSPKKLSLKIKVALALFYLAVSLTIIFYPLPKRLYYKNSRIVESSEGMILRITLSQDDKLRVRAKIEDVSPLFLKTLILKEDRRYFFHFGVDLPAILRALFKNISQGKIVEGASTITMQTARILEPKKRTLISKIKEALRAIQFEILLGKKKILETYINNSPYGGNVEGIYTASIVYFNKKPIELLPEEIAILIALPRNPSLIKNKKLLIEKAKKNLNFMLKNGLIKKDDYVKSLKRLKFPQKKVPFLMPHAVEYIFEKESKERIKSTLSFKLYRKVMSIVKSYRPYFESNGSRNIAVCVVDYKTGEIKVLVGSFDFFDKENSGEIKGFNIKRSTGSTLKPFIYAKAIELGIINPESLLEDFPKRFGTFMPKNFSEKFRGLVRAEDALSNSLNIPFVFLLKRVGLDEFEKSLKKAGIECSDFSKYGLTAATGGIELSLIELVKLYYVLRSGGVARDLKITKSKEKVFNNRIFSMGSVYLTLKALSKRERPDALFLKELHKKRVFYWKTGTSWGRRDAWSIGFGKRYIVGVWGGNFSGRASSGIYGANLSAPVMFDILGLLEEKDETGELEWFAEAKREIEYVDVCSFSGYIPNENCKKVKKAPMLKKKHTLLKCPYHIKIIVERKSGYRACPGKEYEKGELEEKVFLNLPPQVSQILNLKGLPDFSPDCSLPDESGLYIESPVDGKTYFLFKDMQGTGAIVLKGYTKMGKIYWFVNGEYVGETKSGESLSYIPQERELEITADDTKSTRSIKIKVIIN